MSTFATLPAPFVYAALFDESCILWDVSKCGNEDRHCLIYDTDKLRYMVHFITALLVSFGVISDINVFRNIKNVKMYDFDQSENQRKEETSEYGLLKNSGSAVTNGTVEVDLGQQMDEHKL